MADISQGIDAYFWLSLSTLFCTSIGLIIRYAYRSKCSSVSCCCLKITRDIETEEKEDLDPHHRASVSLDFLQETTPKSKT